MQRFNNTCLPINFFSQIGIAIDFYLGQKRLENLQNSLFKQFWTDLSS